jgi:hypothetical protein
MACVSVAHVKNLVLVVTCSASSRINACNHFYSKGFYNEAVVLLNKAIKEEKNEKGLYINRGGWFMSIYKSFTYQSTY